MTAFYESFDYFHNTYITLPLWNVSLRTYCIAYYTKNFIHNEQPPRDRILNVALSA